MKKSKRKIIATIAPILLLIFFIVTIIRRNEISQLITAEVEAYGFIVILIATILSEIIPQYIGPQIILVQAGLLGFSPEFLTIIVLLGTTISTLLGFYLGKKFGQPLVESFYSKRTDKKIENAVNKYGIVFVALAAITPLPYLPVVFGALGLSLRNILFFGLVPRLLGLIVIGLFFL